MLPISHKTSYWDNLNTQNDIIAEKILAYYEYIDPIGEKVSNVGGWHSKYYNKETFPIQDKWLGELFDAITQSYNDFIVEAPKPVQIILWMMVSGKDDYIKDHQHLPIPEEMYRYESLHRLGYPVLSGTYYVSMPFGNDQSFYIKDKENNLEYLNTTEGELTLFYSYIMHGTIKNPSTNPRVSIAFNVIPEINKK